MVEQLWPKWAIADVIGGSKTRFYKVDTTQYARIGGGTESGLKGAEVLPAE